MKRYKIIKLTMFLLFVSVLLTSCNKKIVETGDSIKVYFCDMANGNLFSENVPIDLKTVNDDIEKVQFVMDALVKGPQVTAIQTKVNMHIQDVNLNITTHIVYVTFDKGYYVLSPQEQIGARSSIVYSLTELDFIEGVKFFVEDKPMANSNGMPIGTLSRREIVLNVLDPNPPTTMQTVTLYFANSENKKLVKEKRDLQVNNSTALEKYIVDELIKGPKEKGERRTIPKETVVNDVSTKEGVCQVDLSFDLKSKDFTTPESKTLMIYSIVNSLTELPEIQKVAFLIDGKKEVEFSKDIDLSEFFERKEALIE